MLHEQIRWTVKKLREKVKESMILPELSVLALIADEVQKLEEQDDTPSEEENASICAQCGDVVNEEAGEGHVVEEDGVEVLYCDGCDPDDDEDEDEDLEPDEDDPNAPVTDEEIKAARKEMGI